MCQEIRPTSPVLDKLSHLRRSCIIQLAQPDVEMVISGDEAESRTWYSNLQRLSLAFWSKHSLLTSDLRCLWLI